MEDNEEEKVDCKRGKGEGLKDRGQGTRKKVTRQSNEGKKDKYQEKGGKLKDRGQGVELREIAQLGKEWS